MAGPNAPAASASRPTRPRIPRDVWGISVTSLFSDWGYEMVLPVLPFFLTYTLLTTPFVVGLIDGAAQFGQSITSELSGRRWAARDDRRQIAASGYATTTIGHAVIALATIWPQTLVLRVSAWMGRGVRQPIKSGILANASTHETQGRAFGLQQALDSVGAVLGTLVAILVLLWAGLGYSDAFRTIFAISIIPGAIAVVILLVFVRDDRRAATAPSTPLATTFESAPLPRELRWFFVAEAVFGLGYFSILLALLRVGETLLPSSGGSIVAIVVAALLLYLLYNVIFTVIAYPAGRWADRAPGVGLVATSFGLFIGVDVLLLLSGSAEGSGLAFAFGVLAFVIAGLQVGIQGVAESAWVARQVPSGLAGKAFGRLGLIQGLAILIGSLLAGGLWTYVSASLAFSLSAVLCAIGTGLVLYAGSRAASHARSGARAAP